MPSDDDDGGGRPAPQPSTNPAKTRGTLMGQVERKAKQLPSDGILLVLLPGHQNAAARIYFSNMQKVQVRDSLAAIMQPMPGGTDKRLEEYVSVLQAAIDSDNKATAGRRGGTRRGRVCGRAGTCLPPTTLSTTLAAPHHMASWWC